MNHFRIRSWKDCRSQKLKDSVQLQTVLALYDPETVRNKKNKLFKIKNISEIVF